MHGESFAVYEASAKADAVLLVSVWPCSRYGSIAIFHLKTAMYNNGYGYDHREHSQQYRLQSTRYVRVKTILDPRVAHIICGELRCEYSVS